jgi:hypothetical protein
MKWFICAVISVSLVAVGCLAPPLYKKIGNSLDEVVYAAPYAQVWEATMKAIVDEKVDIDFSDEGTGEIKTTFYKFEDGDVANYNCDMVANRPMLRTTQGEFRGFRYAFELQLDKAPNNQTKLKLTPILEAYEWRMYRDWFKCTTKGVIEDRVFNRINKDIKAAMEGTG